MKLLKYEAGRGQRNLGRNQVTQPAYGGLKLEILDRKTAFTRRVGGQA